ncbi:MAG: hypothetical protein IPP36_03995 [Nitrosomonadales bacterium]|nr:hypothetical protein [Nitrosomonadales bacterium]
MFKILFAALLLSGAALSSAAPLNAWNLNLGAVGGTNATQIGIVTLNGYSELDQTISGNSAFSQDLRSVVPCNGCNISKAAHLTRSAWDFPPLTRICIFVLMG